MTDNWLRDAAVVDWESLPIEGRPDYPPPPVGLALMVPGKKPRYLSFGHTSGNNSDWYEVRKELGEIQDSGRPMLYHNAKFDVEVTAEHMDLPIPPWEQIYDTLPMLFLLDPRADTYALKPSADRVLGLAATERDVVVDWLVDHQPVRGKRLSDKPKGKNYAGGYVALAPPKVTGPYAIGDVKRTRGIARVAYKELAKRGMLQAYDLERELMPHLLSMEKQGVRVATNRLARDIKLYERSLERLEAWLFKRLKVKDDFNLNSGQALAEALIRSKAATKKGLGVTETGKIQTNKAALDQGVTDQKVLAALRYRAQLCTCLRTFMKPWLNTALRGNGRIFTTWHSTRSDHSDGGSGTRTGRLSSTPNFQNLAKRFKPHFYDANHKNLPKSPVKDLPPLPLVRGYVVPYEKGEVLIDRDYSGQELRILGHFEGAALSKAYAEDPWLDPHKYAQSMINKMLGSSYERKHIKNVSFGILYGIGLGRLAENLETTVDEAKKIRSAYLDIFPGLKEMQAEMKRRAKAQEPIFTWGGREYYCEEPKMINNRWRHFDYKLINVLIQGSAADCTKKAALLYLKAKPKHHRLYFTVHDELLASVPKQERDKGMDLMRACMEEITFGEITMLTEGTWSSKNWNSLRDYDKKGKKKVQ